MMAKILLVSKHDELLLQYGNNGNIQGYTKETINKGYNWKITVTQKELNWQLKQVEKINKELLKPIM